MRDFRLYMLVGGMPQAVNEYLDTNNLSRVDKVKRGIIDLYIEDFGKIDPSGRAARLFSAIPSELSKNASRYQVSSVLSDSERKNLDEVLEKMRESMTENIIYDKLLSDKLSANLGYVYENIVAQVLTATGNKLFYHTWPTESGKHNYEVDFLLSRGVKPAIEREERELAHYPEREQARPEVKLWPLEVKSSGYKSHASLDAFCKKFSARVGERFLVYTKDYRKDGATTLLPVVMTMML